MGTSCAWLPDCPGLSFDEGMKVASRCILRHWSANSQTRITNLFVESSSPVPPIPPPPCQWQRIQLAQGDTRRCPEAELLFQASAELWSTSLAWKCLKSVLGGSVIKAMQQQAFSILSDSSQCFTNELECLQLDKSSSSVVIIAEAMRKTGRS